jgi:hypothetical protein
MRTVNIDKQDRALNALLKRARNENLILRSSEGNEFILAEIDDFNREIQLTRQNKSLMRLLSTRARQKTTISLAETKKRLGIGV